MVTSGKDPKVDFPSRLNQALDAAGFAPEGAGRQQALAKKLEVSQQAAGKWLRGETLPELARVIEIAVFTGRNVEWLLTGRGPERALRPDEVVRMDEHGEISVLKFSDDASGRLTHEACVAAEPAGLYQVVRQDPALVVDVVAGALGAFGLVVDGQKTRIDGRRGLQLHAHWKNGRPASAFDFGTHEAVDEDDEGAGAASA